MRPAFKKAAVVVIAGIVVALAAMLVAFPEVALPRDEAAPLAAVPPAGTLAQTASGSSRTDAGPAPEQGKPPETADVRLACSMLDDGELDRAVTDECVAALEARFLPLPVSRAILPVSPPLTWGDVFGDVGRKIELVEAALADAACDVPDGEIRPDLAARCVARAMAELHVLRESCRLSRSIRSPRLSRPGFDLESLRRVRWERVYRNWYLINIDGAARDRLLARWTEEAPDQQTYAAGRERLDDLYFRTAWKRARCAGARDELDWTRGDRWYGLLGRAARLGDSFALAHHLGGPGHAVKLAETDPPLAQLQLASLELRAVWQRWTEEDSELGWRNAEERLDDNIRLLTLAGMDCGDPCTVESVSKALHRYPSVRSRCQAANCENLEKMLELERALGRPVEEFLDSMPARSLPHRKRAEAVAIKHVLAVEALARAAGVEVDEGLLRRVADPDDPELLSVDEVEQARSEAARLVADFQAGLQ